MKKEFFAAALLVLVLAGVTANVLFSRSFTEELRTLTEEAEAQASAGDWQSAGETASRLEESWRSRALYVGIFIRHSESGSVEDALNSFISAVESRDAETTRAASKLFLEQVRELYHMERPSLASILCSICLSKACSVLP